MQSVAIAPHAAKAQLITGRLGQSDDAIVDRAEWIGDGESAIWPESCQEDVP